MSGQIRRAAIRRLAQERRIPIVAAAHKYGCMSVEQKRRLCEREERLRLANAPRCDALSTEAVDG